MGILTEYLKFSGTMFTRTVGMTLYTQIDFLLLGALALSSDVAIYKVAWVLATVVNLPLEGATQVFPSIASRFYSQGKITKLAELVSTVTLWTFTLSLLLYAGAVIYRTELLTLFGSEYSSSGGIVLIIIGFAQLVSNAVGPQGSVLLMTGFQKLNTIQIWFFGVLNVGLNFALISEFGLLGATLATFSAYVLLDIIQAIEVWYLWGITPFTKRMGRPVIVVLVASGVMIGVQSAVPGIAAMFIGGTIATLVYLGLAWKFVAKSADKEAIIETIPHL